MAIAAARRGDLAAPPPPGLSATGERALKLAVGALHVLAGAQPRQALPQPDALVTLEVKGDDGVATAASAAAGAMALHAVLCFSSTQLEVVLEAQRRVASSATTCRLELALSHAWLDVAHGASSNEAVRARCDELKTREREALAAAQPSLVIRLAVARALLLEQVHALPEALDVARRAARMSRTESLPQEEYLAALVLARIRRLTGRPYLATRILTALASYAPEPWKPAVGWELVMASGTTEPLVPAGAACILQQVVASLVPGTDAAASYRHTLSQLHESLHMQAYAPARRDVHGLRCALDPTAPTTDPVLIRWRHGEEPHAPPYGLIGLDGNTGGAPIAYVLATQATGQRVLHRAATLLPGATVMESTQRKQARIDALLAGLALAIPHAVEEADLFRSVYGFKYARNTHKDVLHVAIHRARERLGRRGEIVRDGSMLRMSLQGPVFFPDPRCAPLVDDRVLQLVARRGTVTAKDAAGALGIPLRSVQSALRELVEGGACQQRREGRRVAYRVEDTTFREPSYLPR